MHAPAYRQAGMILTIQIRIIRIISTIRILVSSHNFYFFICSSGDDTGAFPKIVQILIRTRSRPAITFPHFIRVILENPRDPRRNREPGTYYKLNPVGCHGSIITHASGA